jgi:hypothetical protein
MLAGLSVEFVALAYTPLLKLNVENAAIPATKSIESFFIKPKFRTTLI